MFAIYKYPIPLKDSFLIEMPTGAQVLSCHIQHGEPQLWALVDRDEHTTTRRLFTQIGTGHPIDEDERAKLHFIGTYLLDSDRIVLHLLEIVR